ncbi:MAG: GerAB/ArcD/ProY family transporter [Clostridia bacterium]|nr:GerAB/ArcD/ProY family transporter [Clostridia bacterium]
MFWSGLPGIIITYPALFTAPPANHDVWLNALGAMLLSPLLLLPLLALARRFPQQTLVQYCQALLGPMGKIIGLLYIWFFVHLGAIYLRQFTELFTSVTMPETPPVVFSVAMAVLAAVAVRSGLEVIGRMVELIGPFVFFSVSLVVLLLAKDVRLENLLPVMEKGFLPNLYGSIAVVLRYVEIVFLAMISPYLSEPSKRNQAAILGIAIITFFRFSLRWQCLACLRK